MKSFFYYVTYLALFILAFTLLKNASIMDLDNSSRKVVISKFVIMIVVLIAVTRWGVWLYSRLTGYKK